MTILFIVALILVGFIFFNPGKAKASSHYQDINSTDAKQLLKDKNVIALDVRTPAEVNQGNIENAIHIDVNGPNFITGIDKLDKTKTYLVYCRSGRRSINACNIMSSNGFQNLYNLSGGFNSWK